MKNYIIAKLKAKRYDQLYLYLTGGCHEEEVQRFIEELTSINQQANNKGLCFSELLDWWYSKGMVIHSDT